MKRRFIESEAGLEDPVESLGKALAALSNSADAKAFLQDLCTPAELEALSDRWRVVPYIVEGLAYREIHERCSVSVTTIGRVARCLASGHGGYQAALRELKRASLAASNAGAGL